ncbi:MAG: calcium-binding protein [Burkholderiales bacterium]|nr:calcium-binding protein [Burkholderiales bacterium]
MRPSIAALALLAAAGAASAQQMPPEFAQRLKESYRDAFALYDANRDGVLTRAEALGSNLLLAQFGAMDFDRSGAVTQAELARFLDAMPLSAQ